MWRPCWTPTGAIAAHREHASFAALAACALCTTLAVTPAPTPPQQQSISSNLSPAQIIARHARAMHPGPSLPEPASTETLGLVEGSALLGTFHEYREGRKLRTEVRLGPLYDLTVDDGMHLWQSDENGDTRALTGILRERALTANFIAMGGYVDKPESRTYLQVSTSGERPCYEFSVQAPQGDVQRICIDAQTYLLDWQAFEDGPGTTTTTFSDYRTVSGYEVAFRSVQMSAGSEHPTIFSIDSVRKNRVFDPALFERPPVRYVEMSVRHTIVPMRRVRSGYEVPVRIGVHQYWFLLDSGSQGIVVDRKVVQDLGLRSVGRLRAVGARSVGGLGLVHLDALSVGAATLEDLTVGVLDLSGATQGTLSSDGVLGFPFFDAAVVRFDPHAMTLEITMPGQDVTSDGERLPVQLDRQVPIIDCDVNGTGDAPFLVDTGSSAELLLYGGFVDRHPGIVPLALESRTGLGIGGSLALRGTTLSQLRLGSVSLFNIQAGVVVQAQGAFADRFDAGSIGMGILRNFVVVFDEPGGVLYFQRGPDFDDGRFRPQYDPLTLPTMH